MDYIEQLNVMLEAENFASSVTLLPISPWGHFTTALNGAVQNAVDNGFDIIAFQVDFYCTVLVSAFSFCRILLRQRMKFV